MRAQYFILPALLAFSFAACAEGQRKSRNNDDDDDGAGTSGQTTSGVGGGSSGGTLTCTTMCGKAAGAGCEGFDETSCMSQCQGLYAEIPQVCHPDANLYVSCLSSGNFSCDVEGAPVAEGDCSTEFQQLNACAEENPTTSTSTTTSSSSTSTTTTGGGGSCYAGLGCDPLDPVACGPGEACDYSNNNDFQCFPPPNDATLGGFCDPTNGPWCQHGGLCVENTCRAYCCTSTDCTGGGTCQVVGEGVVPLKACL